MSVTPDEPSSSREERVNEAIAAYLEAVEQGESLEKFLAEHPDIAPDLNSFIANQAQFQQDAGSLLPVPTPAEAGTPTDQPTVTFQQRGVPSPMDVLRYFGDYELIEEIARGGMGVVYKARQVTLNRIVAVKMILGGRLAGPEDVERFHVEAEAAAQLDHPGIVPIYEVGEHDGQHYFSMGFVDGQSLSKRVADGPLPAREAVGIVKVVAEAVHYAHEKGVIHRDLKPGNILLDKNGQPRVTDFGLAKLMESGSNLTGTGQILGTPNYMPPEQAAAQVSAVGRLSDVYSLGAILYCLLSARPPFQSANPLETLLQVQKQEPVPPRQLNPNIPLDLDTIVLKCLDKAPTRRFASAKALAEELQRYLDGRPILARPVGRLERFRRWCRREPIVAGLSAAVAAALVVGTAVSAFFAVEESNRATSEASARQDEAIQRREAVKQTRIALAASKEAKEAQENEKVQAESALQKARELRHSLYLADMNRIEEYARVSNVERIGALLNRHIPQTSDEEDLRGFDWYYWWKFVHGELMSLKIDEPVEKLAVSPDGLRVAVGATGGRLHLFDAGSGAWQELTLDLGEPNWAALTFSRDGLRLLAAGTSGGLRNWDLESGRLIRKSAEKPADRNETAARWPAAIAADERFTVAPDPLRLGLVLWSDGNSWDDVPELSTGFYVGLNPGGNRPNPLTGQFRKFTDLRKITGSVVGKNSQPRFVMLANKPTFEIAGEKPLPPEEWGAPVFGLGLSASGQWLASGNREGQVRIWNTRTLELHKLCEGHSGIVWDVAFSADERLVASAGHDGLVIVWNVATGEPVCRCRGHVGQVRSVLFEPEGRRLASAGDDGAVRLWLSDTGESDRVFYAHPAPVKSLVLAPGGEGRGPRLVSGSVDGTIRVWDLAAPPDRLVIRQAAPLNSPVVSRDGSLLAVVQGVGSDVHVWDLKAGVYRHLLSASRDSLVSVILSHAVFDFSPDQRRLAVPYFTDLVVWNLETARPEWRFNVWDPNPQLPFQCCAFSSDGRFLAAGCHNGQARIWDLASSEIVHSWGYPPPAQIREIRFVAEDAKVAVAVVLAGQQAGEIRLRRLDNGSETIVLKDSRFHRMMYSAAGDLLALVGGAGIQLLSLADGSSLEMLVPPGESPDEACFSAEGKLLAVHTGADRAIHVWDLTKREKVRNLANQNNARAFRFADGDRLLAIPTESGTVDLWDWDAGQLRRRLPLPAGPVHTVSLSPDGTSIAAAVRLRSSSFETQNQGPLNVVAEIRGADGTQMNEREALGLRRPFAAYLPDGSGMVGIHGLTMFSPGGKSRQSWGLPVAPSAPQQRAWSSFVAVSPDSQRLASVDFAGGPIQIWQRTAQAAPGQLPFERTTLLRSKLVATRSIAFSPDAARVAVAGDDALQVWDVAREHVVSLAGHAGAVNSVAWSPDASRLASAGADGTVRLWDVSQELEVAAFRGHIGGVNTVVFPEDQRTVVSGGHDGALIVWDLATGEIRLRLQGHNGPVHHVSAARDGSLLLSGGNDGTVRLWRAEPAPSVVERLSKPPERSPAADQGTEPAEIAPAPTAASEPDRRAAPRQRSLPESRTLKGHTAPVWGVAIAPDGTLLASGSDDHTTRLWNPDTGEFVRSLIGHTSQVRSLAFSPDGQTLASASFDMTVGLWDPATGAQQGVMKDTALVYFPAFTKDGKTLVTGSGEKSPRMWNVPEQKLIRHLDGHTGIAWAIAVSRETNLIASGGGQDGTIKLWNAADGSLVRTFAGHSTGVNALAFSPDGRVLAGAAGEQTVKLWNPANGELVQWLPHPEETTIYDVAFAPDGKSLATASGDRFVRLWDLASGRLLATFAGGGLCIAFAPDGKHLAGGGSDNLVYIWDVPAARKNDP
jgi:WD40 repeat protein/serine/threonine protein kinase